jgi:curved DNA-binding protein CbpA
VNNDPYKVLNINEKATPDEIHRAYRALAWRYHPDRNHSSTAAALMARINEAYEVLREPKKRSVYDNKHTGKDSKIDDVVLRAARETLLKKKWTATAECQNGFILVNGNRRVRIAFVPTLTPGIFNDYRRRNETFCVILAVRLDQGFNATSKAIAVIDLMYSRLFGNFPDDEYGELFQTFLKTPTKTHR